MKKFAFGLLFGIILQFVVGVWAQPTGNVNGAYTSGMMYPQQYAFASLPPAPFPGAVAYCTNCRNITGATVPGGLSGQTITITLEAASAGTGALVVYRTVGGASKWVLLGDFNTAASA